MRYARILLGRQVLGHVDGHLLQPQLLGGLVTGVTADDHPLGIDDDGLAKAELADRLGHGIDGRVILAGIARVGRDPCQLPLLDLHIASP